MKILVVEDDFTSWKLMQHLLRSYGECDIAVNGREALEAFAASMDSCEPYDLVCLDIMMPEMDGQAVLKEIRRIEERNGVQGLHGTKAVMITSLSYPANILEAFREQCDGYLVKPIDSETLESQLRNLGLIN